MNIMYLGKEYEASFKAFHGKEAKIFLREKGFEIYINNGWDNEKKNKVLNEGLKNWFYRAAEEVIAKRLEYFREIIGVSYNDFRIKEQKTRWGSCSSKQNLNFNCRLVMAPLWVLDYVVVHELCHLKHMNHSKEFWNAVALYCTEYKAAKDWLKKNGRSLNFT
ncbi:MAG: M48 family metallopeptidase [Bacillota bacterium]